MTAPEPTAAERAAIAEAAAELVRSETGAAKPGRTGAAGPSPETMDAARTVREAVVRLARRLRAQRADRDVSATGIALLSRLYRNGPATPKALADAQGTQPQTLTRVIAALEKLALINRRPDPTDGRAVLLDVTAEGIRILQVHANHQVGWLSQAMDDELTVAERDILRVAASLLDRLADHQP